MSEQLLSRREQGVDSESVASLVMEYLDGCTAERGARGEKPTSGPLVVDLLEQVCSAALEAHRGELCTEI